jgi:hypothetical protein
MVRADNETASQSRSYQRLVVCSSFGGIDVFWDRFAAHRLTWDVDLSNPVPIPASCFGAGTKRLVMLDRCFLLR